MFVKTLPRYREYNDPHSYLELHDNHTAWKLDNENKNDDDWRFIVEDACRTFEDRTGVKIFLLGRSSRHVCIEDNPANVKKYQRLRKLALQLENEAIKTFNEI